MNTEDIGTPVALITFEGDKKKNKTLSIENDKFNVTDYLKHIKLTKPKEKIQYIPNKKTERQILYITGASGSGKSYYTKQYCDQYRKLFPKNPIYLISSINEDSSQLIK
jgi:chromosomal replication initiation ATPase DnaA